MSGKNSKNFDEAKRNRLVVAILQKEQLFLRQKKTSEAEKVRELKKVIRSEVLDKKNYGGRD